MQVPKDDIRRTILRIARQEFFDKGFKNTSMRTLAKRSEVSLSNIYNYFKNKDEILQEILSDVLKAFESTMAKHNSAASVTLLAFHSDAYIKTQVTQFLKLISNYKDELHLLFFQSSGSQFEHFKEDIIEQYTQIGIEYIHLLKAKYPEVNANISHFFVRTCSAANMSLISDLIMHDLNHNELEQFIREYVEYSTAGWKKLLQIHNE